MNLQDASRQRHKTAVVTGTGAEDGMTEDSLSKSTATVRPVRYASDSSSDAFKAEIIEAARRRGGLSWRSPGGPLYQGPLLAIFLIAVLSPLDVLQRSELARVVVRNVQGTLTAISEHADLSRFAASTSFPEVALLTCALFWAWLPICILTSAGIFEYVRTADSYISWRFIRRDDGRVKLKDLGAAAAGIGMFLPGAIALTMLPGDWSVFPGLMTESRIGLAAMLWAGFWLLGISLGMVYPLLRTFIDINLRGK